MEKITNLSSEKILKIILNQIKNKNHLFDEKSIFSFISTIISLQKIFNKDIGKLPFKKFIITKQEQNITDFIKLISDWEIKLILKIHNNEISQEKRPDPIYSSFNFLRNIFAHHDEYKKNENDKNYYLLITKNDKELMILQYNLKEIKEKTEIFIKSLFIDLN